MKKNEKNIEEDFKSDLKTRGKITKKSYPFNLLYLILIPVPHEGTYFLTEKKTDKRVLKNQVEEYGQIHIYIHILFH